MAAGMGSRYGGLKQVDPVGPGGETIVDYSVYDAMRAGFGKLVFVIRRDIETDFRAIVGKRFEGRLAVEYVFQELDKVPGGFGVPPQRKKPWGTGHAILMADGVVREPFAVINADDFYGAKSFQTLADHLRSLTDLRAADFSMVGFILRNTLSEFGSVARGVCQCDAQGFAEKIVERLKIEKEGTQAKFTDEAGQFHPLTGNEIVSMNMWGFTPAIFGHLRERFAAFLKSHGQEEKTEFIIPSIVNDLVMQRLARVKVLPTQASWFGVTYKEDKPAVAASIRRLITSGDYPEKLWN